MACGAVRCGTAACAQGEDDTVFSSRYQMASAVTGSGSDRILWVHGGCWLDYNCSSALVKLTLPGAFKAPQVRSFFFFSLLLSSFVLVFFPSKWLI